MHLVETMAYVGQNPWHGLGNKLAPQQPIEVWKQQAGMDWQIEEAEVRYVTGSHNIGTINAFPQNKVLYRSDTKKPLAVVSKRFQVVQPGEILEFYRDLTATNDFELETAGVLREGRKFWALARTGQSATLRGRDRVNGYLLLATACDGTLATTAQFTSVRVVCNNTLAIAVVSKRFQVVQPGEILEFYRDLTATNDFELETAGVLREGRKFWALARTGQSATLRGRDRVNGYLLLATACDGTLATTAQFTSVRVVCNNTLAIAVGQGKGAIKVPHRSQFDPERVKRQLGITVSAWDGFVERMKALCERPVDPDSAEALLRRILTYAVPNAVPVVNEHAVANVRALIEGGGRGSQLSSSRGTAWGLLNGITEYVDHHRRARSDDHRRDAAWFGEGARIKQRAWEEVTRWVA